jgi:Protein of unknown function (DUF3551)
MRLKMIRLILVAAVATATLAPAVRGANAREAPWCATSPIGWGTVIEDCSYWSLEACVPYVIAGNRGFCSPNPRYPDPPPKMRGKSTVKRR